jgi:hypothetical protein
MHSNKIGTINDVWVANALGACAVLLEALSDVDSKFAKLADKECESLSTDVRKWFKKLAVRVHINPSAFIIS